MKTVRRALLALVLAAPATPTGADPLDARWGASAEMLDAAVPGLRAADPPVAFGAGLSAARMAPRLEALDLRWRAWFQSDADGRLVQILLDRRRAELRPGDADRAIAALSAAEGPPLRLCRDGARAGGAQSEAIWRLEDADLTLGWMDADLRPSAYEVPKAEALEALRDGRVSEAQARRRRLPPPGAERRSRPRRLVLRLTDPLREDLRALCPPPPAPRPAME